MSGSILANEKIRQFAGLAAGVGVGPLSLRLCAALGFPLGSQAQDSVGPIAAWLTSPVAQLCAAALLVVGVAVWLVSNPAGPGQGRRGGRPEGDRRRAGARA